MLNAPPTGINDFNNNASFKIFPNPANEFVNIDYLLTNANDVCQIIDINGRIVKQQPLDQTKLNISDLNNGVYFLQIISQNADAVLTQKLVVTH